MKRERAFKLEIADVSCFPVLNIPFEHTRCSIAVGGDLGNRDGRPISCGAPFR